MSHATAHVACNSKIVACEIFSCIRQVAKDKNFSSDCCSMLLKFVNYEQSSLHFRCLALHSFMYGMCVIIDYIQQPQNIC